MQTYSNVKIGTQRGRPRVWLEGNRLALAGFDVARRYTVKVDVEQARVTLTVSEHGDRIVSRKEQGGRYVPVIDISNGEALSVFSGLERIRVVYQNGTVHFLPIASEARKAERKARLVSKLENGEPLTVGSVSTGVGLLTLAAHQGLAASGLASRLAFACEIDHDYIEQCAAKNPAWNESTVMVSAPMQELAFDSWAVQHLPAIDILECGIPCTAHSTQGRAKKKQALPEDDPNVGHLSAAFLSLVAATNPACVVVENVALYMTSSSFAIIRNQLEEWGYRVSATVLKGEDFGAVEHRNRMAMVALTEGIEFNFDMVARPNTRQVATLGELLDPIADDSDRWSTMQGLKDKEVRDREKGSSFAMQIYGEDSDHINTLTRGYSKVRSSDPKIFNKSKPELLRQLTAAEHARIKEAPPELIEGLSETRAHEVLGQGVLNRVFRALFEAIGRAILSVKSETTMPDLFELAA